MMLAMLFFAGIGNAFGYNASVSLSGTDDSDDYKYIKVTFTGISESNSNECVAEVGFSCSSYGGISWITSDMGSDQVDFPIDDSVDMLVSVINKLYSIQHIYVDGEDVIENYNSNGQSYTFLNNSENHIVNVVLEKMATNNITLTLNKQEVANVYFGNYDSFNYSTNTSKTVEVPSGYDIWMGLSVISSAYPIKHVEIDGVDVTNQYNQYYVGYGFENVSSDHTVNVEFDELPSKTISVTFNDVVDGDQTYEVGGDVLFDDGDISCWTKNALYASGKNVKMYLNPQSGFEVSKVVIIANGNSTDITDTYKANDYYIFESLDADYTVYVDFVKVTTHRILVRYDSSIGNVNLAHNDIYDWADPNSGNEYNHGSTIKLVVYNQESYGMKSIVVDGTDVTYEYRLNKYYEFSNLSTDHIVDVEYDVLPTITVDYDNNQGYVYLNDEGASPRNPRLFDAGSTVRMIVDTYYGNTLSSIVVDGINVTTSYNENGYYEFSNISDDHTVTVTYVRWPSITVDFDDNQGYVNFWYDDTYSGVAPLDPYYAISGSTQQLYVWPKEGYGISSIVVDGYDVTASYNETGYYEISNVVSDHTVSVTFEEWIPITVEFNEDKGYINISGYGTSSLDPLYFAPGSTLELRAYPSDGYKVGSIYVGGNNVTETYKENGYINITLNSSCDVSVEFVIKETYNINVTCDTEHGSYWLSHLNPILEGTDVWMDVYPDDGYIATITENGREIPFTHIPDNGAGCYEYQFTNLNANHTLDVTFKYGGFSDVTVKFKESQVEFVSLNGYWDYHEEFSASVTAGTTSKIKVWPKVGYEVESVFANGTESTVDEDGWYVFMVPQSNGTADCVVTITMKKKAGPGTVTATIPSTGVGTYSCEYDLNFTNASGIKAYVASGFDPTNNQIVLTRVNEVPAGTGLVIKGAAGPHEISTRPTNYIYANMLRGVVYDTSIRPVEEYTSWNGYCYYSHYILGTDGKFEALSDDYILPANSAYLPIPQYYIENSSAKIFTIFLEDEEEINSITTGVGFIWAGEKRNATATDDVYNLQGQKVNSKTLKPGIYIKNGKKFMVK